MAEFLVVQIVEVRQLCQHGPLLHQVPAARRLANRLQDDLGGEGWKIHALGSGRRDGFTCPSHVLGPHSGHRLHPAFRIRPADGLPVYGKTIALIYKCIPGLGICFSLRRYAATSAAHYTATRLHAYGATRRAQPNGGRAAHGRPRAMLQFLREVPSGPPESRLHPQAFIRNRAARLKIPGLNREASPAFPLTLCVNINRRARASAFAETRAAFASTRGPGRIYLNAIPHSRTCTTDLGKRMSQPLLDHGRLGRDGPSTAAYSVS